MLSIGNFLYFLLEKNGGKKIPLLFPVFRKRAESSDSGTYVFVTLVRDLGRRGTILRGISTTAFAHHFFPHYFFLFIQEFSLLFFLCPIGIIIRKAYVNYQYYTITIQCSVRKLKQQSVHTHPKQQKQKVLFIKYISAHKLQLERSPKQFYGTRENN